MAVARQNSADRNRMDLLASSVGPHRLDLSTADHRKSKQEAALAPCAGNVSAAGRNKSLNEAGRFHFWAQVEHAKKQQSAVRRSDSANADDLFGRGRLSKVLELNSTSTKRETLNILPGQNHCVGDLAGGISEAETVASARDVAKATRSPRPEAARGEFQPREMSREARDAMRFTDHQKRPARARSADQSRTAGYAGLNAQDHQERRSGDTHGRKTTNNYHERYAENAHGSSLPGSGGAAADSAQSRTIYTPRRAINSATCDPSKSSLTASVQAKTSCRFYGSGNGSAEDHVFKRGQSQNGRTRLSNVSSVEVTKPAAEPAARSTDCRSPRATDVSTGYTPGRMDRRPKTPRAEPERAVVAMVASPEASSSMQLSAGGGAMTSKRRVQDGLVPAARQTSSPIAPQGSAWNTTASGLDVAPRSEASMPASHGGESMPSKRRVNQALVPAARMTSAPISWSDSRSRNVFVAPSSGAASLGMASRGRVNPGWVAAARQTSAPFATD